MLDPRTHQPTNSFQLHKTHSYYDTWEAPSSGFWPSKPAEFGTELKDVDESGICSPPLWTTSPPNSPQHRKNHYRSLSPASRTQAIVRGQRELMEMVRNMPESSYELSLKDLVEHQRVEARQEKMVEERILRREGGGSGSVRGRKVVDKIAQVKRSGGNNVDRGGFYLKMGFPFSLWFKDKKKNNKMKKKKEALVNGSSKVSPRPSASDGSGKGGGGGVDKEWWKKSPSACKESDSGESSINSGSMKSSGSSSSTSSSSRCNSRHEKSGGRCWPFIRRPKSLTQK